MFSNALRRVSKILVAAHFVLNCATLTALADQAPIAVQNRFPLHYMFLSPRPTAAQLPAAGAFQATAAYEYGSVYVNETNDQWQFLMDMEIAVFDLSMCYGITPDMAVRLDLPLVRMDSGFMDGFLDNYHNTLGLPNYGREDRPENEFAHRLTKDGALWTAGESGGFEPADITVSALWALSSSPFDTTWQSTLVTSIKLPTGDPGKAMGSGNLDIGLFLPVQTRQNAWTWHLMPGFMYHGDPDSVRADVSARESYSLFAGAAYAYNEKLSLIGQLSYFSTPIETTGIAKIDDGAYSLTLGCRRNISRHWDVELALIEDIFTRSSPDFMVRLGILWHFGKSPP